MIDVKSPTLLIIRPRRCVYSVKTAFHNADIDILADILARIVARMSVSALLNAGLSGPFTGRVVCSFCRSVALSVCLSLGVCSLVTTVHFGRMAEVVALPFGTVNWVGQRNRVLDGRACTLAPRGKYGQTILRGGYTSAWIFHQRRRRGLFPDYLEQSRNQR